MKLAGFAALFACLFNCGMAAKLLPVDSRLDPDLFVWTDTCNVYVVRHGDSAVLINCGDGSVVDHLAEIGVIRVEWVLFTDHHREQCQGAQRLLALGVDVGAPAAERELFEDPVKFRRMEVKLGDPFTIHGASYVRPPIRAIPVARAFKTNELFEWHGRVFTCLDTPGNSPGGMSYLLASSGRSVLFSGDVMLEGAKMRAWYDTEWDYGFADGIRALRKTVTQIIAESPSALLPSHGQTVSGPREQLQSYADKLARLEKLYMRGYDPEHGSVAYQDKVSKPTVVSNVWQVSPHLFKFKRPNFWPNFSLILADNGHALLSDCGLLDERFLDTALEGMRQHFGLRAIDAIVVSHMHGDHFLEAEHLREKWGTQVWALDRMVDKMEHPERFDYAAPIQAYGKKRSDGMPLNGVRVDRVFRSGDTFNWEGRKFTIDWMPGQTEFALCLHGSIDGRKVAFTGDNIFGDPDNPAQSGHEAMVAHNSAILDEGYIVGAEYLSRLKPDLLMGGHSFVMDHPAAFIDRYRKWAREMRDAFRSLSSEHDYRYWFDPFWVRAEPYRAAVKLGDAVEIQLHIRNFNSRIQRHRIEAHAPMGLTADTAGIEGELGANSEASFPIRFRAGPAAKPGVHIVAFDVVLDGRRFGERFDCVVNVEP